jgi:hypothetical protein
MEILLLRQSELVLFNRKRYVEDLIDRVEVGRTAGVIEAINQKVTASMTRVVDQAAAWRTEPDW